MSIDQKLDDAIKKAHGKFSEVSYDKHVVRLFIGKVGGFYRDLNAFRKFPKREKYKRSIEASFLEIGISDNDTQRAYKIIAGAYFGPQGGIESGKTRRTKKESKQEITKARKNEIMQDARGREAYHKIRSQN